MAIRYGRAGGNWSAAGTWSATSGGASDGAGLNAGDDVVLNASSTGSFTIDTTISIATLDCTGFVGTLTHNAVTLSVSGLTFTFGAGMTYTATANTRIIQFTGTSGTTSITTAGKTLATVTCNGAGGTFQLVDTLTMRTDCVLTVTAGTFNANNQNVTVGFLSSTGAGVTRAITFGTGTWTLNAATGTVIDFTSAGGNLTLTTTGSNIVVSSTPTAARVVNLGTSKTYNTITVVTAGTTAGSYFFDFNGTTNVTIATLNITTPSAVRFGTISGAYNVTTLNCVGTSYNASNFLCAISTVPIITATTVNIGWAAIYGLTFSGGSFTATNSFDLGHNSGISISGPGVVTGGTPVTELGAPTIVYNNDYPQPSLSTNTIITASGHKLAMIGQVWHPTKKTGTLNIRKVHFRTGTLTLNAASEVRVSLQNVSATAGPPYQPDGTQDQFYDFKTATQTLVASAINITGNLSADRVVDLAADSLGDTNSNWLAVVWEFNAFNTSDSVIVSGLTHTGFRTGSAGNVVLNTGTWATVNQRVNNLVLECDDGTYAFMSGSWPCANPGTASVSSSAALRRVGVRFSVPTARVIDRAALAVGLANGSDGRLVLYDGDGTTELASVDIDNDAVIGTSIYLMEAVFPPVTLLAGVFYRFVFVGTTTTNATVQYLDMTTAAYLDGLYLGQNAHYTSHDGSVWNQSLVRQVIFGLGVSATHGGTLPRPAPTYQLGI